MQCAIKNEPKVTTKISTSASCSILNYVHITPLIITNQNGLFNIGVQKCHLCINYSESIFLSSYKYIPLLKTALFLYIWHIKSVRIQNVSFDKLRNMCKPLKNHQVKIKNLSIISKNFLVPFALPLSHYSLRHVKLHFHYKLVCIFCRILYVLYTLVQSIGCG